MLEELLEQPNEEAIAGVKKTDFEQELPVITTPLDITSLEKQLKSRDAELKSLRLKNKQLEKKIAHMEEYANWHKERYEQQCQCNVEIVQNFQKTLDTLDQSLPDHIKALYDHFEEAH